MARRGRIRRVLKWSGLGLSVLIALAWAMTSPLAVRCSSRPYRVGIGGGHIWVQLDNDPISPWEDLVGWHCIRGTYHWGLSVPRVLCAGSWEVGQRYIELPFWVLFLLVAVPTGILFWRDRRHVLPGHCACGYDLTGNTSGVCPECGEQT